MVVVAGISLFSMDKTWTVSASSSRLVSSFPAGLDPTPLLPSPLFFPIRSPQPPAGYNNTTTTTQPNAPPSIHTGNSAQRALAILGMQIAHVASDDQAQLYLEVRVDAAGAQQTGAQSLVGA